MTDVTELTTQSRPQAELVGLGAISPDDPLAAYTPAQRFALTRYARFALLRRQVLPDLEAGDWRARLIHKALYAAYLDCRENGVEEEARLFGARDTAA